ncbi:radical SAM protein [Mesoterricola sediminis]|uniref:radical SAM protein n=1 Tax=Mesoterricola sediminis TaxID=2927980 RepID=UPI001FAFF799|nr:radical SAM protein [Mesoterricola sediminis]
MKAHLDHRRAWQDFDYCYPVISRRSKGVSLGVNLNPDKVCNFDCVYCEVDRTTPPRRKDVDLDQLAREMEVLLDLVQSGELFQVPPFDSAAPHQRRLNDIAFSGDGEPTTLRAFPQAVARMAALRSRRGLRDLKLVLITDASRLQAPEIQEGLEILMDNGGEVWAKLDAGTEAHYQAIDRSKVPFQRILDNLAETAARWPIVIQTLFLAWQGQGPSDAEVEAYIGRLQAIRARGTLAGIQIYTVARPTPEPEARPLPATDLDRLAARVKDALPDVALEVFYGPA